jgi:hypothetical protein
MYPTEREGSELRRRVSALLDAHGVQIAALFRDGETRGLTRPLVMVHERGDGDTAVMLMTVDEVLADAPDDETRAELEEAHLGARVLLVIIDGVGHAVLFTR